MLTRLVCKSALVIPFSCSNPWRTTPGFFCDLDFLAFFFVRTEHVNLQSGFLFPSSSRLFSYYHQPDSKMHIILPWAEWNHLHFFGARKEQLRAFVVVRSPRCCTQTSRHKSNYQFFFVCVHRSGTSLPCANFLGISPTSRKEKEKICQVLQMNTIITHKGLSNQLSGF